MKLSDTREQRGYFKENLDAVVEERNQRNRGIVLRMVTDNYGVMLNPMTSDGIIATIGGQYGRGGQIGQIADKMMGCGVLLFAKIYINNRESA